MIGLHKVVTQQLRDIARVLAAWANIPPIREIKSVNQVGYGRDIKVCILTNYLVKEDYWKKKGLDELTAIFAGIYETISLISDVFTIKGRKFKAI